MIVSERPVSPSVCRASNTPRAVPIVIPDGDKFKFDEEALTRIFEKNNAGLLPISVISIAGAFRKGKSFLLNIFIRYLSAEDRTSWLNIEDSLAGFSWRGGSERDTTGILVWDHVFKIRLSNGTKVGVLLMDTQGAFDGDASVKEYATIFALSTLLSSLQIFNVSQMIQENDFQHLELFLEYGRLATQDLSYKPFQSLMFLVRDWSFPYEYEYGLEGGKQFLLKKVSSENKHPQLARIRQNIASYFQEMLCYLMPHPGLKVASNPSFRGNFRDVDEDFLRHASSLIKEIFSPEKLKCKQVNGENINGRELIMYFQSYTKLYNGDDLPEAKTVFEATMQASMASTSNRCFRYYTEQMDHRSDRHGSYLQSSQLRNLHFQVQNEALERFEDARKLGSNEVIARYRDELMKLIETSFNNYEAKNNLLQIECSTRTPIVLVSILVVCYLMSWVFTIFWIAPLAQLCYNIFAISLLGLIVLYASRSVEGLQPLVEVLDRVCKTINDQFFAYMQENNIDANAVVVNLLRAARSVDTNAIGVNVMRATQNLIQQPPRSSRS